MSKYLPLLLGGLLTLAPLVLPPKVPPLSAIILLVSLFYYYLLPLTCA
jgi:hypothetical protein